MTLQKVKEQLSACDDIINAHKSEIDSQRRQWHLAVKNIQRSIRRCEDAKKKILESDILLKAGIRVEDAEAVLFPHKVEWKPFRGRNFFGKTIDGDG